MQIDLGTERWCWQDSALDLVIHKLYCTSLDYRLLTQLGYSGFLVAEDDSLIASITMMSLASARLKADISTGSRLLCGGDKGGRDQRS